MASIGLSKPYFAKYSADGSVVTYSGGALLGKYTDVSITVAAGDKNTLWADDGPDEADNKFQGGTFACTTNDLLPEVMMAALGVKEESITAEGISTLGPKWLLWDDDQDIPYLGIGGIIQKQINSVNKWAAFVLPKIQLDNPDLIAETRGEKIVWQTQKLTATILRSDEPKHRWKMLSSLMDSAADAEAALKQYLKIV